MNKWSRFVAIIVVTMIGFGVTASVSWADEQHNRYIVHLILEKFWQRYGGDTGVIDEWFTEDYVNHDLSQPDVVGREEFKQWATGARDSWTKGMPDWFVAIDDLVAEGNKVSKRWTLRGTHNGDLMGIPPTGKPVMMRATTLYVFNDDGKVTEIWWNYDALGLMQQIGQVQLTAN